MDALQIQKGSVPNAQVPCCRYDYLMRRVMVWWVRKWKGKLWRGGVVWGVFFNQAKCYRGALNETYLLSVSALHLGESSSNDLVNFTTWKMQKGRNHNSSWTYKVFTGKKGGKQKTKKQERTCANALTYMTGQQREKQYRWLNVLQQLNRAALALKQCLCTVHDLPDNLLQVSLFFKQVIDYFQECLKTSDRKRYHWHYSQQSKAE